MKVLVSGFIAFAGFRENITEKIVNSLPVSLNNIDIYTVILPVEYENAFNILDNMIDQIKPDFVIATGMAASRKFISIEKIAVNIDNSDTADNAGVIKKDSLIVTNEDIAKTASLEYPDKVYEIEGVKNSYSAGTYVCNDLFYRLLSKSDSKDYPKISFIHFPSEDNMPYEKQLSIFLSILSCL